VQPYAAAEPLRVIAACGKLFANFNERVHRFVLYVDSTSIAVLPSEQRLCGKRLVGECGNSTFPRALGLLRPNDEGPV
jgi:hypothetical protein